MEVNCWNNIRKNNNNNNKKIKTAEHAYKNVKPA